MESNTRESLFARALDKNLTNASDERDIFVVIYIIGRLLVGDQNNERWVDAPDEFLVLMKIEEHSKKNQL